MGGVDPWRRDRNGAEVEIDLELSAVGAAPRKCIAEREAFRRLTNGKAAVLEEATG
jgi:hypothetical protein